MNNTDLTDVPRVFYRFENIEPEEIESPCVITADPITLGFWSRQFRTPPTTKQRVYDWVFGVVMPLICFFFDPFVFREHGALLASYRRPVYYIAFVSVMTLSAWLLWGERSGPIRGAMAAIMAAGSVMAAIVGVVLFPFALIGSLVLIGLLGFTPIFTAIIYCRNAVRAFRSASMPNA